MGATVPFHFQSASPASSRIPQKRPQHAIWHGWNFWLIRSGCSFPLRWPNLSLLCLPMAEQLPALFFPFLSQKSSIVSAEEEMPVNGFNEQWNGPAYALYISVNLLAFSCRILMQKWPNSGWFGELYVRHNGSFFVFDCTLSYSWSYSVSGGQFWHRQTHWRIFYIIVWFLCNNRRCPRPRGGDSWRSPPPPC